MIKENTHSSSYIAKIQALDGSDILITEVINLIDLQLPFTLYSSPCGKLTTSDSENKVLEIYYDEKKSFILKSENPCKIDKNEYKEPTTVKHCSVVEFTQNIPAPGNIFHFVYSQNSLMQKGIFYSKPKTSVFNPVRKNIFQKPNSLRNRLIAVKWMFPEREHLK